MDLRNCSRCGKLFQSMGQRICPDCVREEQKDFEKVREYLWENKDATIYETSQATGVSTERINQFVREGRLVLNKPELECMSCGQPIKTGKFCAKCLKQMQGGLRKDTLKQKEGKPASRSKYHIAERVVDGRERSD